MRAKSGTLGVIVALERRERRRERICMSFGAVSLLGRVMLYMGGILGPVSILAHLRRNPGAEQAMRISCWVFFLGGLAWLLAEGLHKFLHRFVWRYQTIQFDSEQAEE